jgi:hypothetical protein
VPAAVSSRATVAGLLLASLMLVQPTDCRGQATPYEPEPEKQVHWALAAFFGTGWYQVDENRTAYIFRIPPRQVVRRSGWQPDGQRQIGVELQYPVTLGLHTLDDIPDFIEFENYGTITFTPGVQVEIPVNRSWYLRPYAHLGAGYERKSGEWAGIWYGGLKSRYLLGETDRHRWSLLNALYYAGYKPEFEQRGRYGSMMAGFEFDHALGRPDAAESGLWLNWHLTYNYLFDNLNFHIDEERVVSIRDTWELGLALGKGARGVKIGFLTFEHVGLAFKWSSNGDYRAITLNLRSPFTE